MTSTRGGSSFHSGLLLGVETSCDETSVAILDHEGAVHSNLIASQIERHRPFGGVVPEIASREHLRHLMPLVTKAVSDAGATLDDISAIAVTSGPGLIGALLVGVAAAQALAWGRRLPLYPVNHLEGHIVSPYLNRAGAATPMPGRYLALVVSGGHSSIYDVRPRSEVPVAVINRTRDDAAGEVFDKVAKFVGFPYPGGPHVERASQDAAGSRFSFPVAKLKDGSFDFSFSGLKASAIRLARVEGLEGAGAESVSPDLAGFCKGFQAAIVEQLIDRLDAVWRAVSNESARPTELAIAGGVAANGALRDAVLEWGSAHGVVVRLPEKIFCTDNAAMIAFAAMVLGERAADPARVTARSRFQPGTRFP
ncbi:MAG: tRNA (adenosine(37)-N6)-threonylcarbamoyltransferase complex transferase subunit TsaD [Acidobacteria bacterium]|nr:tRNA (adenosine(37)-N6)-threonylcarbamoyltransferase complex transferase subunit TsaD [Acidobacteriota bacterium]